VTLAGLSSVSRLGIASHTRQLIATTATLACINNKSHQTMADLADEPAPPVAPPKRSLFSKPIVKRTEEVDEAVDFFSRAKTLYPQRLAEEEKKRQKKIARLERKRSSTSAEHEKTPVEEKKRRVFSQAAEDRDGYSSEGSHAEETWTWR
jgi:hypothetical protein